MLRVVVMVSGGGTNLQAILDSLDAGVITNAQIVAVISNKPDAYALIRASKYNIPGICVSPKDYNSRKAFHQALIQTVDAFQADLIVLAGYLVILPEDLVNRYENRIINIHPSLIPSFCGEGYYGLRVHEAVLKRGNKVTGATVHYVDTGCDTGPIISQKAVEVLPYDTPETLQKRVMEQAEWHLLPEAINLIANQRVMIEHNIVKIK